ncbi:amidohydrolase family protein [Streptomyces sp. NPDC056002]|uniref:amidohydrolase family protein n=1 Tax=Streptomyces sp. NPDC056002 TaxID=3345675 RepID=UPI0035D6D59A
MAHPARPGSAAARGADARTDIEIELHSLRPRRPDPWAADLAALACLPDTVAKLSGLVTSADRHTWSAADLWPFVSVALEALGPKRLMFGSDWPVGALAAEYEQVVAIGRELMADLSEHGRAAVFAGTAARVYGL